MRNETMNEAIFIFNIIRLNPYSNGICAMSMLTKKPRVITDLS